MMNYSSGKVTAVIPVYNEERFLRLALESVVTQADFVIIGDNASNDGTEKICLEFESKYSQVKYYRHSKNRGGIFNFQFCYDLVQTEYVFHMGGHDIISENYVDELRAFLDNNSKFIGIYPRVAAIDFSGDIVEVNDPKFSGYTPGLDDSIPFNRCSAYVKSGFAFCLIYGLFRSEIFKPLMKNLKVAYAADYLVSLQALMLGCMGYTEVATFFRRIRNAGCDNDSIQRSIGENININFDIERNLFGRELHNLLKSIDGKLIEKIKRAKYIAELEYLAKAQCGFTQHFNLLTKLIEIGTNFKRNKLRWALQGILILIPIWGPLYYRARLMKMTFKYNELVKSLPVGRK
jgi:glycosyltransferase involved in cell wall biosynthesis